MITKLIEHKIHYSWNEDDEYDYEVSLDDLQEWLDSLSEDELSSVVYEIWSDIPKEKRDEYVKQGYPAQIDLYSKEQLEEFLSDNLEDKVSSGMFEDELKEFLKDKAIEEYKDNQEYWKDPLGYYGMSQRDFM